jgi:hypothetical protein
MRRLVSVTVAVAMIAVVGFATAATASAGTGTNVISISCPFSHQNMDDPIVHPDEVGAAHMHDFFGNESTNAHSTYASMREAPTTCRAPSDTAGYWTPSVIGPTRAIRPRRVNVYYRGDSGTSPFPPDFRMVAGATVGTPAGGSRVFWSCGTFIDDVHSATMVNCETGKLTASVKFPFCWDGVLTHANDTSHVTYSRACRSGELLPRLEAHIKYAIHDGGSGNYTLASDAEMGTSMGRSLHADFWNTWDQEVLEATVARCLGGGLNCTGFRG